LIAVLAIAALTAFAVWQEWLNLIAGLEKDATAPAILVTEAAATSSCRDRDALSIDGDISFLSRLRCLRRNISRPSLARRGAFYQLAACGQPNAGDRIGEVGKPAWRRNPMDQRIESFLADVLAFAGEEPDAVPEGVRRALA
jgi:hypothetical protein